jgi:hypothetical protein
MSKKAITITATNQSSLATQYGVDLEDIDELLPTGYILVAEFGAEKYDGVITTEMFTSLFTRGVDLENDYYEAL